MARHVLRTLVALCVLACTAPAAWAQPAKPACTTFNASNEPSSAFKAGDKIIVRGTGFGVRSLVFVRFEQGSRAAELVRVETNDLGAFAAEDAQLPTDVADGKASILTLDARGSATCDITLSDTASAADDGWSPWMTLWLVALIAFALVLAVLTFRRWKTERLKEAMDSLTWRERFEATKEEKRSNEERIDAAWETDDWGEDTGEHEAVVVDPEEAEEPEDEPVTFPIGPDADEDDGDDDWFRPSGQDDEEHDEQDDDLAAELEPEEAERRPVEPMTPAPSPPRLAPGWDEGRIRPARRTSDAIERLQREVKTWGRT